MNLVDISHDPISGRAQIVISFETDPRFVDEPNEPLLITRRWELIGQKLLGDNELPPYKLVEVRPGIHGDDYGTFWHRYGRPKYRQEYQLSFESGTV